MPAGGDMLKNFGRYLQIVGLMTGASALVFGVQTNDPSTELGLMVAGATLFYLGYGLAGRSSSAS
jgi:hypothetical protein